MFVSERLLKQLELMMNQEGTGLLPLRLEPLSGGVRPEDFRIYDDSAKLVYHGPSSFKAFTHIANANMMVAAVNALPDLIKTIRRQREIIERVRRTLDLV